MTAPELLEIIQPSFTKKEFMLVSLCFTYTMSTVNGDLAGEFMSAKMIDRFLKELGKEGFGNLVDKFAQLL